MNRRFLAVCAAGACSGWRSCRRGPTEFVQLLRHEHDARALIVRSANIRAD
jgi:hypothetical protein